MDMRRSYKALVDLAKVLLPLAGLVALSLMFLLVQRPASRRQFEANGGVLVEAGQEVTGARIAAVGDGGDELELRSDRITLTDEGVVLQKPDGTITSIIGEKTYLRAGEGFMPSDRQVVELRRNVRILTDFGYRLTSEILLADMDRSQISSPVKVHGLTPFGEITAGSMMLRGDDTSMLQQMDFLGGVHLIYDPQARRGDSR